MKILSNSALDLTFGCLDKGFDIGNLVDWEVNGEIIEKDSNTNNESCLTLNWSQGNSLKGFDNKTVKSREFQGCTLYLNMSSSQLYTVDMERGHP